MIFCGGMPSYPAIKELLIFFMRKGFWVFNPRYRGTWESDGLFLKISPHQDIFDIIEELPKGFKNLWDGRVYKIKPSRIFLIGSSFGGPAVLLNSSDLRVTKVVAFSPVIDWRTKMKTEPLDWMEKFVSMAFGNGYRFKQKDWGKLKSGKFYNPMAATNKIDGRKIFIIATDDDKIIPSGPTKKFAKMINCKILSLKKGGHMGLSNLMKPKFYKKLREFIRES